jgi:hypothetical protein
MPKRERKMKLRGLRQTNSAATSPGRMVVISCGPGSSRKRKGPAPGTVDRYGKHDRTLYPELNRLMNENNMSLSAAAQQLADNKRIKGTGTPQSLASRLARRYRAERS